MDDYAGLNRMVSEHLFIIKRDIQAKQQAKQARQQAIENSTNFKISFTKVQAFGVEEFRIEDYPTALKIFELYRQSGFLLKLNRLTLWTDKGEKIKR